MAGRNVSEGIPNEAYAITPSDTAENAYSVIYVGGAGNIAVRTKAGQTVTFTGLPVGGQINLEVDRVMATSTTATLLIGMR